MNTLIVHLGPLIIIVEAGEIIRRSIRVDSYAACCPGSQARGIGVLVLSIIRIPAGIIVRINYCLPILA
jgi:hypothetical protein